MNEREFVEFLKDTFPFSYGIGIGDDTSTVKSEGYHQLITKDVLIEGIHFRMDYFNFEELALKALAVNLSDIAAMGGVPEYYYLGIGMPEKYGSGDIKAFYSGLRKGNQKWQIELAGGDYSQSPSVFISITMVGKAKNPVYRNQAGEKDLIGITGPTGESAIGLKLLEQGIETCYLVDRHKRPLPRIKEGTILSEYVNSMIDISDGVILDLKRVLTASGKGATIFYPRIPVSTEVRATCLKYGFTEEDLVLGGGEDYELLFTISPENETKLRNSGLKYFIIGEINGPDNGLLVKNGDKTINQRAWGYDHFETSH
jgi:thiamine-monophosphate kinase